MSNYKIIISYDGTSFSGWQTQPNDRTVQATIENIIRNILCDSSIKLIGSGRTDSGVHAYSQVANFNVSTKMTSEQIQKALNSKLPEDILIKSCEEKNDNFHSRFSALKREYVYYISSEYIPMNRFYSWYISYDFDYSLLIECSKLIKGEHDFSCFSKASNDIENKNCIIYVSKWYMKDNSYIYEIIGNRFLHHMVRFLVGTMFEVARGRFSIQNFKDILNCKTTNYYPVCAPANGLFLKKVFYEK